MIRLLHSSAPAEALRLCALEQYRLTGPPETTRSLDVPAFLELTTLAAQICDAPLAGIAILGSRSVEFHARVGPGPRRVARGADPAELCVRTQSVFEIRDARYDSAFRPHGILVEGCAFRFYAAAPLTTPSGIAIGCLFVMAPAPRSLTSRQAAALTTLARQVITHLEFESLVESSTPAQDDLYRIESALAVEQNFVSAVLDTVGALVAVFDTAGRIVRFNRACEQLSGYDFAELQGRQFWTALVPPDDITFAAEQFHRIRNGSFPASFQSRWQHRNGSSHRISWAATALLDEQDQPRYIIATGVDITEQVRTEEQLRLLTTQSNSILESVGDGILGADLQGCVTFINPAASQMLGFQPAELLGRSLHQAIHHTHADGSPYPEADSAIDRTLQTLDTVRVSTEVFWRKDGSSFPVEYVARPQLDLRPEPQPDIQPASPRAIGLVVAFRDITESRALDRIKDELISTVSHELRTPLTSLRAALGLVTGGALESRPHKKTEMLALAVANTDRLIRLVNDFLDIERLSSGSADLHLQLVSAHSLFTRASSLLQPSAEKAQLRFHLQPGEVQLYVDPDRILQTLTNLLSNSIKFSPPGGLISLTALPLHNSQARIDISDQGRGIPSTRLDSIFERFQQVDASDTRERGGTGLGLAICRSIVTQHGGLIWATSPPGHGATFHLTLPTRPPTQLR